MKLTEQLAERVAALEQAHRDAMDRYADLAETLREMRKQLAQHHSHLGLRPQGRCPKCKAPVHPAAKACARCGSSWDPERNLDRGKPL